MNKDPPNSFRESDNQIWYPIHLETLAPARSKLLDLHKVRARVWDAFLKGICDPIVGREILSKLAVDARYSGCIVISEDKRKIFRGPFCAVEPCRAKKHGAIFIFGGQRHLSGSKPVSSSPKLDAVPALIPIKLESVVLEISGISRQDLHLVQAMKSNGSWCHDIAQSERLFSASRFDLHLQLCARIDIIPTSTDIWQNMDLLCIWDEPPISIVMEVGSFAVGALASIFHVNL
ncbi:hypothetical protein C8J56DRAFT_893766 [Mycena floridula]|nr:hypothetical protein C8J56DRAFT_893766 [Mycena floridula]